MNPWRAAGLVVAVVMLCAAFCGCGLALAPARHDVQFIHFFVVPKTLPDGSSSVEQMAALRTWLVQTAGGYTELPQAPGAWINHAGSLETSDQAGFLVSSVKNLKKEIAARIKTLFRQTDPFVEVWSGIPDE